MPNATLDDLDAVLDTSTLTSWELILAGIVFVVAILLARLVRRNIRSWLEARPGVAPHVPELIGRLSGWAVTLVGIVAALMVLGFQMGPVVPILLIFAVTAAVSARRIMENWAAGLSLQIVAPFTVGDRIETQGITGWVKQINSRAVVLSSRDRRTVHIPNSMVVDSV
jgi:small conductance mechanosensitive channel